MERDGRGSKEGNSRQNYRSARVPVFRELLEAMEGKFFTKWNKWKQ